MALRNRNTSKGNKNYEEIVKKCKEEGCLFEDPEFPAWNSSIVFSKPVQRNFEWKRPSEICDNPQFLASGANRFDVVQGGLGDSWLIAALASLTCNSNLLNRVIMPDQDFSGPNYCGVFKFNLWHQGDWIQVVVDDRLPTYNGRLIYMHSAEKNEFWSALLEKAFAKLHGCYECLEGGSITEAMVDFTGGFNETINLKKESEDDILNIMMKAHERGFPMGCVIESSGGKIQGGLIGRHEYSVTSIEKVKLKDIQKFMYLVRLRNAWGNEKEWEGKWGDRSKMWSVLEDDEKQRIGLNFADDGEFWMAFEEWITFFTRLDICSLSTDALDEVEVARGKMRLKVTAAHGEWISNVNAGGCRNYVETFATNPQYRVVLTDSDNDEDEMCTMIVCLQQKDGRKRRMKEQNNVMLKIGYTIYKVDDSCVSGPLDTDFVKFNSSVARSQSFTNAREAYARHKLSPGTYVIIPSTFEPNQNGKFLLRIFTEQAVKLEDLDEDTSLVENQEGPPATEEDQEQGEKLSESFKRLAGADRELDAFELKDIIKIAFKNELKSDGFGLDVCRSMVAMHDSNFSGRLGFNEFLKLQEDLRKWKAVFKQYDKDNSGLLSANELRAAFHDCGFRLSTRTLFAIIIRYCNKERKIEFDDFVPCAIRLKTMIESFNSLDPENKGVAAYDKDTFMQTTMYS